MSTGDCLSLQNLADDCSPIIFCIAVFSCKIEIRLNVQSFSLKLILTILTLQRETTVLITCVETELPV